MFRLMLGLSFRDLLVKAEGFSHWPIVSIIAISITIGLLIYLILRIRRIEKTFEEHLKSLQNPVSTINSQQPNLTAFKREVDKETVERIGKLAERIELIESDEGLNLQLDELKKRVDDLELKVPEHRKLPGDGKPDSEELEAIMPPGQISIETMVEWAEETGLLLIAVKATLGSFGNFEASDDGDNWLAQSIGTQGVSFLFPRSVRFETADHYDVYRQYYHCAHPAAGRILIETPARVEIDPQQGGWKLSTKGTLSVIPS